MRALYNMIGITKQAHYKRVKQQDKLKEITQQVIASAQEIRKKHRNMGCRKLYDQINPEGIGRVRSSYELITWRRSLNLLLNVLGRISKKRTNGCPRVFPNEQVKF